MQKHPSAELLCGCFSSALSHQALHHSKLCCDMLNVMAVAFKQDMRSL